MSGDQNEPDFYLVGDASELIIDEASRHLMQEWRMMTTPGRVQDFLIVDFRKYLDEDKVSAWLACRASSIGDAIKLIGEEWPALVDNPFVAVFPVMNWPRIKEALPGIKSESQLPSSCPTIYDYVVNGMRPAMPTPIPPFRTP